MLSGDHAGFGSLQIPRRLAPSIFVDDIRKSDAADWPEPPHWVTHRQQRIRVNVGRETERGLRFFLKVQVQCGQRRPEPERSCCQQHLLHGRIDRYRPSCVTCQKWRTIWTATPRSS
jgi:hypothetical protein